MRRGAILKGTMSEESFQSSGRPGRRRSSAGLGLIVAAVLVAIGLFALSYPFWRSQHQTLGYSGFNMAQVIQPEDKPQFPIPASPPMSGLSVRGPAGAGAMFPSLAPMPSRGNGQEAPNGAPATNFTQAVVGHRMFYRSIRDAYIAKSPVVRQYFQDWRSTPDLARLKTEYDQDHDVLKFAWGAAKSPSFAGIVQRYVNQPDFWAYMLQMAVSSPKDVIDSWNDYAAKDNTAAKQLTITF